MPNTITRASSDQGELQNERLPRPCSPHCTLPLSTAIDMTPAPVICPADLLVTPLLRQAMHVHTPTPQTFVSSTVCLKDQLVLSLLIAEELNGGQRKHLSSCVQTTQSSFEL